MTSLQAVVPRPNRRIPNPYYVADGVDATLDLLETGLLALVEVLGFNLENNAEATAVRYGLYIQLHKGRSGTPPNHVPPLQDFLAMSFPSARYMHELVGRLQTLFANHPDFPPPTTTQEINTLYTRYKTWDEALQQPDTAEPLSYINRRPQVAAAMLRISQHYGVDGAGLYAAGGNDGDNSARGTTLRKAIRTAIRLALRTDNQSVSTVITNQLSTQEAWESLLSQPDASDWGAANKQHGSFGNVRSVRAEERTPWSERLEAWLQDYIAQCEASGKEIEADNLLAMLTPLAVGNEDEAFKAERESLEEFLKEKARTEHYPSVAHLMRNIRRACDPNMGTGHRQSLDDADKEMVTRCLCERGYGAAGFAFASEKTGLPYGKLNSWAAAYGIETLREDVRTYDMTRPEPRIARLEAEEEEESEEEEGEDEEEEEAEMEEEDEEEEEAEMEEEEEEEEEAEMEEEEEEEEEAEMEDEDKEEEGDANVD